VSKRIMMAIAAVVFGASIAVVGGSGFGEVDQARASVSRLTPYQACEVTYINYPRRHWCDRKGHVHWL
jgi:purine nucleoside phosphorylase